MSAPGLRVLSPDSGFACAVTGFTGFVTGFAGAADAARAVDQDSGCACSTLSAEPHFAQRAQ